jgi:hypothetical protein
MKHNLLLFIFSIFYFNVGVSQDIIKATSELSAHITNKEIAELIENQSNLFPNSTQLSIAIVGGDNTQFIGIIRTDDKLKTIENGNAIFGIGSISKVFTSIFFETSS